MQRNATSSTLATTLTVAIAIAIAVPIPAEGDTPPPPPVDTDGDGVTDDVGQCDTQAGPATNNGCAVTSGLPLHQARSAADYSNSVGMATHIAFRSTPYFTQFPRTEAALAELGIKHIRDGSAPNRPEVHAKYAELKRDHNIGVELTFREDEIGAATRAEVTGLVNKVGDNSGGAVEIWEGINEYNRTNETGGNPDWGTELDALQTKLYSGVQASRYDLPVACPSIQNPYPHISEIPDIENACDYRLMHSYPGGGGANPDSARLVQEDIRVANRVANDPNGTKPLISSETGWSTAAGAFQETSDLAKAKYTTRLSPVYFNKGIMRVHQYQLYDHFVGPRAQAHFGLLRNNRSETPAYRALENQMDIVGEYQDHAPSGLRYALSGNSSDVQTLLLQKRDGTFYLLLWQEVLSYARVSDTAINVPAENVTVRFDSAKNVAVFTPRTIASSGDADNAETHPDRQLTGVTSVTEPIEDEVNIIRIR